MENEIIILYGVTENMLKKLPNIYDKEKKYKLENLIGQKFSGLKFEKILKNSGFRKGEIKDLKARAVINESLFRYDLERIEWFKIIGKVFKKLETEEFSESEIENLKGLIGKEFSKKELILKLKELKFCENSIEKILDLSVEDILDNWIEGPRQKEADKIIWYWLHIEVYKKVENFFRKRRESNIAEITADFVHKAYSKLRNKVIVERNFIREGKQKILNYCTTVGTRPPDKAITCYITDSDLEELKNLAGFIINDDTIEQLTSKSWFRLTEEKIQKLFMNTDISKVKSLFNKVFFQREDLLNKLELIFSKEVIELILNHVENKISEDKLEVLKLFKDRRFTTEELDSNLKESDFTEEENLLVRIFSKELLDRPDLLEDIRNKKFTKKKLKDMEFTDNDINVILNYTREVKKDCFSIEQSDLNKLEPEDSFSIEQSKLKRIVYFNRELIAFWHETLMEAKALYKTSAKGRAVTIGLIIDLLEERIRLASKSKSKDIDECIDECDPSGFYFSDKEELYNYLEVNLKITRGSLYSRIDDIRKNDNHLYTVIMQMIKYKNIFDRVKEYSETKEKDALENFNCHFHWKELLDLGGMEDEE